MSDNESLKLKIMNRMKDYCNEKDPVIEPQPSNILHISVSFDDEGVTCRCSDGEKQHLNWNELVGVAIETTDQGPYFEDVFWYLGAKDRSLRIPQCAQGFCELLPRLQQLPDFDNHALMDAMSCTENKIFICWQKEQSKLKS